MKLTKILTAIALCTAAATSFADTGGGALDLSTGNTFFGRSDAVGSFTDTYTFTLTGASFLVNSTATSSAVGSQDLDFSSLIITDAADVTVATYNGNLGTDANEVYVLPVTLLNPGSYKLVITGLNSATQASYSGNIAVAAAAVPEPETYALMLAGLAAIGFVARRRRND